MNTSAFEFDDGNAYTAAAVRLHAALIAKGYSQPPLPATLCDALFDCFEMQDFQLARALTHPCPSVDWHLIRVGEAGEALAQRIDVWTIAPGLARAFAGLQIELDQARIFPHDVARTDGGLVCYARNGATIASIERIECRAPDLQKRERVNDLLKGLRIYGDRVRFVKRLATLPGLQALQDADSHDIEPRDPGGAMAVPTVNNQCVAMRQMLSKAYGIHVPQHDAQALVAVTFGAEDWNHYVAKRDIAPASLVPAAVVHWGAQAPASAARVELFQTCAEAVFAFSQFCHHSTVPLCR